MTALDRSTQQHHLDRSLDAVYGEKEVLRSSSLRGQQPDDLALDRPGIPKLAVPDPQPSSGDTPDGHQGQGSDAVDLRREDHRLQTLRDWPAKFLSAERAARNGLYYFGVGDALRCQFCKVELRQWKEGDDVEADHGRWSPACPFLLRKPVGNVPSGRDECGSLAGAGRPAHPAFMTEPARLESFRGWPVRMRQTPAALADAGFYYTGSGDQTVCYHCGGGLKDWEDDDEPWEQHALWFNRCPYLRIMKGEEYIRKVNSGEASSSLEPVLTTAPAPAPALPSLEPPTQQDTSKTEVDLKLCKICYGNECNVCFVPCGHVVACMKCAMSLTNCPVCRQPYNSLVKLFYS